MNGRELKKDNDLFFVCSLIEYMGRVTKNHRNVIVSALGQKELNHIYKLADIYHSENIEKISYELTDQFQIENGHFDNISECRYTVPSHWDIGKVYQRLITEVSIYKNKPYIEALIEIYNSWISRKIENFNSSLYYENPDYIFKSYINGDLL